MKSLVIGMTGLALTAGVAPAPAVPPFPHADLSADLVRVDLGTGKPSLAIRIVMSPPTGWHLYWRNPGAAGEAPAVKVAGADGMVAGQPVFERPSLFHTYGIVMYGFDHATALFVPLAGTPRPGAAADISVSYAMCGTACVQGTYSSHLALAKEAAVAVDPDLPVVVGNPGEFYASDGEVFMKLPQASGLRRFADGGGATFFPEQQSAFADNGVALVRVDKGDIEVNAPVGRFGGRVISGVLVDSAGHSFSVAFAEHPAPSSWFEQVLSAWPWTGVVGLLGLASLVGFLGSRRRRQAVEEIPSGGSSVLQGGYFGFGDNP